MIPGSKMNPWTPAEDAKLAQLRADNVRWMNMPGKIPGRTIQACQQRQLYLKLKAEGKKKRGSGGARKAARIRKVKAAGLDRREKLMRQALAYQAAQAEKLAAEKRVDELRRAASEAANARRASRRMSTSVLVADIELRERIDVQGPNGLFGDPKPGRSALDERNARLGVSA